MTRALPCPARAARGALLTAALATGGPPVIHAAPPNAPEQADAVARMHAANALARDGRHAEALAIYERLAAEPDAIDDRAGLLGNMGHCLARLGRPRDAIDAFGAARDTADDDSTRATITRVIERLEADALGRVSVQCDIEGVSLHIGARPPISCPTTLARLDPGPVTIVGSTAGGSRLEVETQIAAGAVERVALRFPARVVVDGQPGAEVRVDGEARCAAPCSVALSSGMPHEITVQMDGLQWQQTITPGPDERYHMQPVFEDDDTWIWIGVGVGAAAVTGTVIGLLTAADEPPRSRMALVGSW